MSYVAATLANRSVKEMSGLLQATLQMAFPKTEIKHCGKCGGPRMFYFHDYDALDNQVGCSDCTRGGGAKHLSRMCIAHTHNGKSIWCDDCKK